jgi:hypothetical protein
MREILLKTYIFSMQYFLCITNKYICGIEANDTMPTATVTFYIVKITADGEGREDEREILPDPRRLSPPSLPPPVCCTVPRNQ